jgi:hypothetical protein
MLDRNGFINGILVIYSSSEATRSKVNNIPGLRLLPSLLKKMA